MSLTTDPNDPRLKEGQKNEAGQHDIYLVLSDEERAKGFVRPVRDAYVHVGKLPQYKGLHRMLSEEEKEQFPGYVAIMTVLTNEAGEFVGGTYVKQEELNAWQKGQRVGGCGTETRMHRSIAETYARNPKYYGATFCCGCNRHLPVNEFFWSGTSEEVGS